MSPSSRLLSPASCLVSFICSFNPLPSVSPHPEPVQIIVPISFHKPRLVHTPVAYGSSLASVKRSTTLRAQIGTLLKVYLSARFCSWRDSRVPVLLPRRLPRRTRVFIVARVPDARLVPTRAFRTRFSSAPPCSRAGHGRGNCTHSHAARSPVTYAYRLHSFHRGQEEYERLRPMSYSKSHVILIAFAIDTPDSLDNVTVKVRPSPRELS